MAIEDVTIILAGNHLLTFLSNVETNIVIESINNPTNSVRSITKDNSKCLMNVV